MIGGRSKRCSSQEEEEEVVRAGWDDNKQKRERQSYKKGTTVRTHEGQDKKKETEKNEVRPQ